MLKKEIKNYKGRCRINLTKKDNEEINSTNVYLFTPEEHTEVKELLKEFEKLENNSEDIEKLKSENNSLQQYKEDYENLKDKIYQLTQDYDSVKEQLQDKTKELDDLKETNSKLSETIDTKEEEFKLIDKELHQVKNKLIVTQDNHKLETDYLRDIISDYESRGIGKRIRNKNPKSYILEPNYILIESQTTNEEKGVENE